MKIARTALLLGVGSLLGLVVPAGAASAPTWKSAQAIALPTGGLSVPQGFFPGLACASAGNCVAVGDYADAANRYYGVVATEANGTWKAPRTITPPANASASGGLSPFAASCAAVGDCVVVGTYYDTTGNVLAFVDEETSGTWQGAVQLALPANALATGQVAGLREVSCASAGNCAAVGEYTTRDAASPVEGLVAVESSGAWHTSEIAAPAGANADPLVSLSQVSCPGAGDCVAAGTYLDADNVSHTLVATSSGGVWAAPASLRLPANASAFPSLTIGAATCAAAGSCAIIGSYVTGAGLRQAFVATSSAGLWRRASTLRMPPGAAANPHVFFYGFLGLSCPSAGNCASGGQYRDSSGNYQGFLVNEVNGVWQAATELALPSTARFAGANGGVVALTCAAAGACTAGAAYVDAGGHYQAFLVSETSNKWAAGTTVALPGGATTVGVNGGIYGVVCSTPSQCTATGSYLDATTNYQAFSVATS